MRSESAAVVGRGAADEAAAERLCGSIELPWHDPVLAFLSFADDPFVAFLDGGGVTGERGRFSYLCVAPFRVCRDASFQSLAADLAGFRRVRRDAPVPFTGGAVGFFGYEAGAALESLPRAPGHFAGVPESMFALYDVVFAWDHRHRRMWQLRAFPEEPARAEAALERLGRCGRTADVPALHWRDLVGRAAHMARVARALEYIRAGDIYQANITAPFVAQRPPGVRAADIYLSLRSANPAPFSAFIGCGAGCAVASVSPERFLRLTRAGGIEARPIKGTRPRGADAADDAREAKALVESAKDHAENLMIVDLLRNDISRVAVPGSVTVPFLSQLESFASVHHLVSEVRSQLLPGLGAVDLLRAAFPGGSITGAPKIRAMQIIAELEQVARGPYCGSAFWIGFDGAMDSSILIRTLTITQDSVVAQAGGGIVADSDPAEEWEELLVKVRPMLRALGPA